MKIAVVGLGHMGRLHIKTLLKTPGVELTGLCDISPVALEMAQALAPQAKTYQSLDAMLQTERPEILVVATQAPQHEVSVLKAARAEVKGILCEKPMAVSLEEVDRMNNACRQTNTKLMVNHQARWSEGVALMGQLLKEDRIGTLKSILVYDKGDRAAGVSLLEIGTHLFDLLHYFAGEPRWVSAQITTQGKPSTKDQIVEAVPNNRVCGPVVGDRIAAQIGFDKVVARYDSPAPLRRPGGMGLEFIGSRARLLLRPWERRQVMIASLENDLWKTLYPKENYLAAVWRDLKERRGLDPDRSWPWISKMVQDLAAAIRDDRAPLVDGVFAAGTLEMILAIFEAHRANDRVMLPLQNRRHPLTAWRES